MCVCVWVCGWGWVGGWVGGGGGGCTRMKHRCRADRLSGRSPTFCSTQALVYSTRRCGTLAATCLSLPCLPAALKGSGRSARRLRPLTRVYSFRRCCAEVMAASTDCRFTRDLMLEAVPYSFASIACVCAICRAAEHAERGASSGQGGASAGGGRKVGRQAATGRTQRSAARPFNAPTAPLPLQGKHPHAAQASAAGSERRRRAAPATLAA